MGFGVRTISIEIFVFPMPKKIALLAFKGAIIIGR